MPKEVKQQIIQKLSDREHILLRPSMYLGSVKQNNKVGYIFDDQLKKFVYKEYNQVDGLNKIINEVLDNSIDEAIRTNFEFANKIKINITNKEVSIEDNGRGIPVVKAKGSKSYMPVLAFTEARAGSNFNDDDRKTLGLNGVGSFITNVYSNKFNVETSDGLNKLILNCSENAKRKSFDVSPSKKRYTKVNFEPDISRFEVSEIDNIHINLIRQRIINLSICFPQISFTFNKEKIKIKNGKSYFDLYDEEYSCVENDNYIIGFAPNPSEDFKQLSFVNGLEMSNGGTHVDYISSEIISRFKDKISKKYKNIKNGDIKNKLQLFVVFRNFPNPEFDSQTKQKLTNSNAQIKRFLKDVDFEKYFKNLYKLPQFLDPIIEIYKIKEEFKKRKELAEADKPTKKKLRIEKFIAPTKKWRRLALVEGESAKAGLISVLGRIDWGYYSLKGVPLNSFKVSQQKLLANQEFKDIRDILGLKLTGNNNVLRFDEVIFATDADADGGHIIGLLITFFYKYAKSLFESNKVKILKTPIIVANKKNKKKDYVMPFFNLDEYQAFFKKHGDKYEYSYKKGLGTWEGKDLQDIIKIVGLENMLETLVIDEDTHSIVDDWMNPKMADKRKEHIKNNDFDLFKI